MKNMCAMTGIPGYFSNHSGKRTCVMALYKAGVPEQEIMGRSGHRFVENVRKYQRPSSEILMEISNTLEPVTTKRIKTEGVQNDEKCEPEKSTGFSALPPRNGIQFNNCVFNMSHCIMHKCIIG